MGICIFIGEQHIHDTDLLNDSPPTGMIKLLVESELLKNTYQSFLQESKAYINTGFQDPNIKQVYNTLLDATTEMDGSSHSYSIGLLNRTSGEFGMFAMEDPMRKTSKNFIYSANHEIDGTVRAYDSLELYLLKQENGG